MYRGAVLNKLLLGMAGLCVAFAPACAFAQPDLIPWAGTIDPVIVEETILPTDCVVDEGCTVPGERRLLRFDTETRNIGQADLFIGDPADPDGPYAEYYTFNECHQDYKMNAFAEFRLKDSGGAVVSSRKPAFCILDTYRHRVGSAILPKYSCRNQGIQAGWGDIYSSGLPCQWVDITNLPAGTYTLEVELNPDAIFVETDYSNNLVSVTVEITPPSDAPPNDDCGNSILLSKGAPTTGSTAGATGTDRSSCGDGDTADAWYLFVPTTQGEYIFSTCGSDFDTTLAIYGSCNGAEIACNDDAGDCAGGSRISATLNRLTPYFLRVSGYLGAEGNFQLGMSLGAGEGEGEGESWEATITSDRDATIYEEDTTAANGVGEVAWAGTDSSGNARRALFHFNLSSIPANAVVTSAELELTAITEGLETYCPSFGVYRVTQRWSEGPANPAGNELSGTVAFIGDATWSHASYSTVPWISAGGDWIVAPSSGNSVGPAAKYGFGGPGMVDDVQAWLEGSLPNHGWILQGIEEHGDTARPFASRQALKASFRPALHLDYTPPQHAAMDSDQNYTVDLTEVLRVIQFYNSDGFHCAAGTEDGYSPGEGPRDCAHHTADYAPQDWDVDLGELLRSIQIYNSPNYCPCAGTEDGFCPGPC